MNKKEVASKMPYLGNPMPRKGESMSKSTKRFSRYAASPSSDKVSIKGSHKSMRRHREKEGLAF